MEPPEVTSRFSFFPEITTRHQNPGNNEVKNAPNSLSTEEPVIPRVIVTNKSGSVIPASPRARVITIKGIKKVRKLKTGERKNLTNLEVSEKIF